MAKDDELFKSEISPASWVMPQQAAMARHVYSEALNEWRKIERGQKKSRPDIVPYQVRMRGIEKLVTDTTFKKFWEQAGEYWVINTIGGLYLHYFGPDDQNMQPLLPAITQKERDNRLDEAASFLKSFCLRVSSDPSVETCFQVAFREALKAGSFEASNPHNIGAFFNKLYESLADKSESGCRHIKTHRSYPGNSGKANSAEKCRFMLDVANLVMHIYGRYNYALTERILNAIRPDIGPFTQDSIRKFMKNRQEPYPFKDS